MYQETYIVPHNVFLREHASGFQNGIKNYMYGFFKKDHPDHPDISNLNMRIWKNYFSEARKKFKKTTRNKMERHSTTAQAFYSYPNDFYKRESCCSAAESKGKTKIITSTLVH